MNISKIHKYTFTSVGILFFCLSLLTIGGILVDYIGIIINIIMGIVFAIIGSHYYLKAKNMNDYLIEKGEVDESLKRFLILDTIFGLVSLLLVLAMLSGGISRIFIEKMPIFG